MPPVSLVVIGAGSRGTGYGRWALANPSRARVAAVAEPRQARRDRFAAAHGIGTADAAGDWRQLAARERFADAVLICTQDRMHAEPVEAFAALGYHVLVEKPMAPDEQTCRRIVAAAERAGVMLAVGHVMRYTPYTTAVKQIVGSGRLGKIMSVEHLEPVGFWHQAHSYVRGNWRRADLATSMLMAKSCHDLDWLQYILGQPPQRVSSFGRLSHFTRDHQPEGAADRCMDCAVEASCAYSAIRLYGGATATFTMSAAGGHGGGDAGLMDAFTEAVAAGGPEPIRSGPRESLASHLAVFAAERARLNGTVETVHA